MTGDADDHTAHHDGDAGLLNGRQYGIEDSDKCDARSSCHWIDGGVLEEGDCDFGTTQPPAESGCCYGNPDTAASAR